MVRANETREEERCFAAIALAHVVRHISQLDLLRLYEALQSHHKLNK